MKQFITFLCLILFASQAHAAIRRVGYPGAPLVNVDYSYQNFQTAINESSNGDTIQVYQQLQTNYNYYVELNKPLNIIGFGHSLNSNTGSQILTKADSNNNNIHNIRFNLGSAGSIVQGLNILNVFIADSNITITRCRFKWANVISSFPSCVTGLPLMVPSDGGIVRIEAYYNNLKNITINGCYFDRFISGFSIQYLGTYTTTNLIVTNNYFNGSVSLAGANTGQVYGVFANNIINLRFLHLQNTYYYNSNVCTQGNMYNADHLSYFDYFLIKNNIINTDDTVSCAIVAPNSIIQNNIFSWASQYACASIGGSNNIYKANMDAVFTPSWNTGLVYADNQLNLSSGSPALNAGIKENGASTNCGIFGGETGQQYRMSGIPPIPSIYLLSTPGLYAPTNPFNVTISVKSNN